MDLSMRPGGRLALLACAFVVLAVAVPPSGTAEPELRPGQVVHVAGIGENGTSGDGFAATAARIGEQATVSVGPDGTVYLADRHQHRVRVVTPDGRIDTLRGSPPGLTRRDRVEVAPDGTYVPNDDPTATAVGPDGRLYIARDETIARWEPDGRLTLVAGAGDGGPEERGDGGPAVAAQFGDPTDIAVDAAGAVYVADRYDGRIRRIAPDGRISTVVGGGTVAPADADGRPATDLDLASEERRLGPPTVTVDGLGNLYFVAAPARDEDVSPIIGKVAPNGTFTVLAGTRPLGFSGDGGPVGQAQYGNSVNALAVDADGNLFFSDVVNQVIRMIAQDGTISTVGAVANGYDLAVGPDGDVYVVGAGLVHRLVRHGSPAPVRRQPAGADRWADRAPGTVVTVAGTGHRLTTRGVVPDGNPAQLAVGPDRTVYFSHPAAHQIGRLTGDGTEVVAGTGESGATGDRGPARAAQLEAPAGIAVGADDTVYVVDGGEQYLRTVADGKIDRIPAARTVPRRVAAAGAAVYVADRDLVARIDEDGTTTTIAGGGDEYPGGEEVLPATRYLLNGLVAIAAAPDGTVYLAEEDRSAVRAVGPDGVLRTVVGAGARAYGVGGFSGDGGPAQQATVNVPRGLAVGPDGSLYIADTFNSRIRRVTPDGVITTIAGTGERADRGDGGPATAAALLDPTGIAVDADGVVYVADPAAGTIRRIAADGTISTVARFGVPAERATEQPIDPVQGAAVDRAGRLYFSTSGPRLYGVDPGGALHVIDDLPAGTLATAADGSLYSGDYQGIHRRDPDGVVVPVRAGRTGEESSGMPGLTPGMRARDVVVAPTGELYVLGEGRVHRIDRNGTAEEVVKYHGTAIALGPDGALYLTDVERYHVHRYAGGKLTVFAGTGTSWRTDGGNGDGGPATEAVVHNPRDLAVAPDGTVYVGDGDGIRRITQEGRIDTVLPTAERGDYSYPVVHLALDTHGNLYYTEPDAYRVRVLIRPGELVIGASDWATMWFWLNAATALAVAAMAFAYRHRLTALLPTAPRVQDVSGRSPRRWSLT